MKDLVRYRSEVPLTDALHNTSLASSATHPVKMKAL